MNQAMLTSEVFFWLSWILIPLLIEIIPAVGSFLLLFFKRTNQKTDVAPILFPEITILVPVYNSQDTLEACIASINDSTYDNELITVLLIDNGSKDDSYKIFEACQLKYDLSIQWLTSNQGKSKALNKGLFNSNGKYIINVDSDGRFEQNSLTNMITRFETDNSIHCLTGVILTEHTLIEKTKSFFLRQVRRLEYMEYCQAFLVGRNYNSSANSLFTISGAYSAFKKSTILSTFLYNTNTICEDAHITFQIKAKKMNVGLCENAIFYVDPIDDMDKLYVQRQRWQIGELEVFHMFKKGKLKVKNLIKEKNFVVLLFDHTFAFPRLIWYFALIALSIRNYPIMTVAYAVSLIYVLYVITGMLYTINVKMYLKEFKDDKKYYGKLFLYTFVYPMYNMYTFVLRFMGIINSIDRPSSWKTYNFTDETNIFKQIIKKDFKSIFGLKRNEVKE